MEKIAVLENRIEAVLIGKVLDERGIGYFIKDYSDSVYDGLWQRQQGWGHLEAPPEKREEVLQVLAEIRAHPSGEDPLPPHD